MINKKNKDKMEMVTRTYKGDDVRLYVEESIIKDSEIDGLIAVNVTFKSEIDHCKINGDYSTVSISKSKVSKSTTFGNCTIEESIVNNCDFVNVVAKKCRIYNSKLKNVTVNYDEYFTDVKLNGYAYFPKSFSSYSIIIKNGKIHLHFKKTGNLWEFETVKAKEILGLLANPPRKFHDDMFKLEHKLRKELSDRIRIQSCPK